jgi:DNA-binding transcriptional MerR regulator
MSNKKQYPIGELAELAGVSKRTVRFYVQKKLIPPPFGKGRGHYYTDEHAARIRKIKGLQDIGFSLDEIENGLKGPLPGLAAGLGKGSPADWASDGDREAASALWRRVVIDDDVELHIRSGRYRLSVARLERLRRVVEKILGGDSPVSGKDEESEES